MSKINPISHLYNNKTASSAGPKANSGKRADLGILTKFDRDRVNQEVEKTVKVLDSLGPEKLKTETASDFYAFLAEQNVAIRFEYANDLRDSLIVKLVRKSTGEVLMQFPPDRSVKLQRLAKYMPGVFFENMA